MKTEVKGVSSCPGRSALKDMRQEVRVVDQRAEDYRWTEDLNAAFYNICSTKAGRTGLELVMSP